MASDRMPAFGSCCKDLKSAVEKAPTSLFHVSPEGVFYLAVGMVQTEVGIGWYDQAVLFCPFCGTHIQDKAAVAKKARRAAPNSN